MIEKGSNEVDLRDSNLRYHNNIRSTTHQLTHSTIEHSAPPHITFNKATHNIYIKLPAKITPYFKTSELLSLFNHIEMINHINSNFVCVCMNLREK